MSSPVTPISPAQEAKQEAQADKEGYVKRDLIAFDQLVNVVAGGHDDETISARSGRAAQEGKRWGKVMAGFLNLFQKNHSVKAEAGDLARAKTVEYLEESGGDLPK